jgi:NAD(P)-dependent dehydrogenase (short-subunit alcohol dehydrogenase family)
MRNKNNQGDRDMGKLEGKIALVTGGNSGIGLATAKEFVGEGAYVFITGRRDAELAAAVKEIGNNVTAVRGDVSTLGDLDRLFAQVKREQGRLDVVFANAGIAQLAPLEKITEEHFDAIFDVNVKGVVFTVQKALPLLPDGASVILNASIVATKGWPQWSVYSATKAALRSFARTWAADLKDRGIRVNAVSPGITDTPGLNELMVASDAGAEAAVRRCAARQAGNTGRGRQGGGVSRLRRQQLHHRHGIVRGWRLRTSVGGERRGHHAHRQNPCPRRPLRCSSPR